MHQVVQFARGLPLASLALFGIGSLLASSALALNAPPTGDTYVSNSSSNKSKNFGTATTLYVGAGASTLIQFNLNTLPPGTIAGDVDHASLILFVNKVTTPGALQVQVVTSGPWSENAVTYNTAPTASAPFATISVPATALNQFLVIDVTAQVKAWVEGTTANNGLLIAPAAASPTTVALLDSKENGGESPLLDITLAVQGPKGDTGATGAKGDAGAVGAKGDTGAAGAAGSVWHNGANVPSNALGADGDYYLDTVNGNVYLRSSGAYAVATNITGPQGLKGDTGATGAQGLKGDTGATGAPGPVGAAGSQGPIGLTGAQGATGNNGNAVRIALAPNDFKSSDCSSGFGQAYEIVDGVSGLVVGGSRSVVCDGVPGAAATLTPINPLGNSLTAIDTAGDVGQELAITLGADGLPVISYYDATNQDLKVAKCTNAACTGTSTITTVDNVGNVGLYTSITVGVDGLPVISYYSGTNGTLKVAKCVNPACTGTSTISTVDGTGNQGIFTSITLGADGLPVISYYGNFTTQLRVAKCVNPACTGTSTITTVDSTPFAGYYTSITLGSDGLPVISYLNQQLGTLKVAKCANAGCTGTSTITTVDSTGIAAQNTSITLGSDGRPVISYYDQTNGHLKVAKCINAACTGTSTITTVDGVGQVGPVNSITLGADGLPVISYYDATNQDLKVAKCTNAACTGTSTITTVDSVGGTVSITLGADGLPVISYYDATNGNLKVVKCSSPTCVPFVRRR